MKLVLQTTIPGRISVWLVQSQKVLASRRIVVPHYGSDQALELVDAVLRQHNISAYDLTGVIIVRGPGSFTAVRNGLIVANTVSAMLRIPVVGEVASQALTDSDALRLAQKPGRRNTVVKPFYGKSANITQPKRKSGQVTANR